MKTFLGIKSKYLPVWIVSSVLIYFLLSFVIGKISPAFKHGNADGADGAIDWSNGIDTILIGLGHDTLFYGCPVCLQKENDSLRAVLSRYQTGDMFWLHGDTVWQLVPEPMMWFEEETGRMIFRTDTGITIDP